MEPSGILLEYPSEQEPKFPIVSLVWKKENRISCFLCAITILSIKFVTTVFRDTPTISFQSPMSLTTKLRSRVNEF